MLEINSVPVNFKSRGNNKLIELTKRVTATVNDIPVTTQHKEKLIEDAFITYHESLAQQMMPRIKNLAQKTFTKKKKNNSFRNLCYNFIEKVRCLSLANVLRK